jgi:uncharacterized membrane protein YhaH (DUF805 family)
MGGLFSMKGRCNRAMYFWTVTVILALLVVLGFTIGKTGGDQGVAAGLGLLVTIFVTITGNVILAFQAVKRLHDLDRPGFHYWLCFIPFYNFYLGLILLFKKGTVGINKYGPDPLAGR